ATLHRLAQVARQIVRLRRGQGLGALLLADEKAQGAEARGAALELLEGPIDQAGDGGLPVGPREADDGDVTRWSPMHLVRRQGPGEREIRRLEARHDVDAARLTEHRRRTLVECVGDEAATVARLAPARHEQGT